VRVILVPVADRPECAVALNTAFTLAHTVSASVIGCHIRPHGDSPVVLPSTIGLLGITNEEAAWRAASKPQDTEKSRIAAKVLFSQLAERHGYDLLRSPRAKPGAVWMEKTGSPNKVLGIMGPVADLLVVSRPSSTGGGALARLFLSASLLKSSRPVLVLPQAKERIVGNRICIAWNQSVEAAQTVAAAMPLLVQADRVTIVSCGAENRAGPKSSHLSAYLKYWGIKSEQVSTRGKDEPKEILTTYKSTSSDLLLIGAYSRNKMSRLVFGGVTEYMLERASVPILMRHS
jgi:nucleotide-binding universal stress UspA family protein